MRLGDFVYNNFDEIVRDMVTPEMNDVDFFKLLLSSETTQFFPVKFLLTQNFDYDLNPKGEEDLSIFVDNVRLKAKTYLNSINRLSEEEKNEKANRETNKTFLSFMRFLSTISEEQYIKYVKIKRGKDPDASDKKKNIIAYYEKIIGDKHGDDFSPASRTWYYYRSYTMSPAMKESFRTNDVKHRLYVSINYDQLLSFTNDFINKLEELEIPYLFKIKTCNPSGKCVENDTIVIYADSEERVTQYVNILEKLIQDNNVYQSSIHKPSAHLGIIDDKIGYGREFDKNNSYSGVIGEVGYEAIKYALEDISFGIKLSRKYTRKEMLEVLEKMKYIYSYEDQYYFLKERFWEKFYELFQQKGYEIDESICIGERETQNISLS